MDISWALKDTATVYPPTKNKDGGRASVGYGAAPTGDPIRCARRTLNGRDLQRAAILEYRVSHLVICLPGQTFTPQTRLEINGTQWLEIVGPDTPQEAEYAAFWAIETIDPNGNTADN